VPGGATGSPGQPVQHHSRIITPHLRLIRKADLYWFTIAYWIAFGPHGPRAQAPPGEGSRVFFGTAIAVGASLALFGTTRLFAGSPPPTMNKEWQEAANEKLVVRFARIRPWPAVPALAYLSLHANRECFPGTTLRPPHRYLFRLLHRQGPGPVASQAVSCGSLSFLDLPPTDATTCVKLRLEGSRDFPGYRVRTNAPPLWL
jgi:hypothetical protein